MYKEGEEKAGPRELVERRRLMHPAGMQNMKLKGSGPQNSGGTYCMQGIKERMGRMLDEGGKRSVPRKKVVRFGREDLPFVKRSNDGQANRLWAL